MVAVRTLHALCLSELFLDAMPEFDMKNTNDDGKRYYKSKYNNIASNSYPLQATLCKYL